MLSLMCAGASGCKSSSASEIDASPGAGHDADGVPRDASSEVDAAAVEPTSGYRADFETSADFEEYTEGWTPTTGAHSGQVRLWYSHGIQALFEAGEPFEASVGATAIKLRDSSSDGDTNTVYVMTKQASGYDTDNGDWYYEQRSGDGQTVISSGALSGCYGCHSGGVGADYDYLRGPELGGE
jgi:hypothetical protein